MSAQGGFETISRTDTKIENSWKIINELYTFHPLRHNLHSLSLHPIRFCVPLHTDPSEHVDRASFLKLESVSGSWVLPGNHTMPCCLYDRASFPILEAVVGRHTEIHASGVPEFLDVDAPDYSP